MKDNPPRRREFLAGAAAAPLILSSAAKGANERITFALIGAGGRGRRVAEAFIEFGGAKMLSACDVYKPNLEKGLEIGGADAKGYVDSLLSKLDSGYGNLDSMQAESPQSVPGVGRQKPLKQAFWGNRSLTEGGLRRAA